MLGTKQYRHLAHNTEDTGLFRLSKLLLKQNLLKGPRSALFVLFQLHKRFVHPSMVAVTFRGGTAAPHVMETFGNFLCKLQQACMYAHSILNVQYLIPNY